MKRRIRSTAIYDIQPPWVEEKLKSAAPGPRRQAKIEYWGTRPSKSSLSSHGRRAQRQSAAVVPGSHNGHFSQGLPSPVKAPAASERIDATVRYGRVAQPGSQASTAYSDSTLPPSRTRCCWMTTRYIFLRLPERLTRETPDDSSGIVSGVPIPPVTSVTSMTVRKNQLPLTQKW